MTKAQLEQKLKGIEKELRKLEEILDTDSETFAKMMNEKHKTKHDFTTSDTYPYRVGVASATVKIILEDI